MNQKLNQPTIENFEQAYENFAKYIERNAGADSLVQKDYVRSVSSETLFFAILYNLRNKLLEDSVFEGHLRRIRDDISNLWIDLAAYGKEHEEEIEKLRDLVSGLNVRLQAICDFERVRSLIKSEV